jgi:hypothetical protein
MDRALRALNRFGLGARIGERRRHRHLVVNLAAQPPARIGETAAFSDTRPQAKTIQRSKGSIHTYQAYGSVPGGVYCHGPIAVQR